MKTSCGAITKIQVVAIIAIIVVAAIGVIWYVTLPPPRPAKTISITPESATEATTITVRGTGFDPGSKVSIKYDGVEVATTIADADGKLEAKFSVPFKLGDHQITTVPASETKIFKIQAGPPIKIGVFADFTGPVAYYGVGVKAGCELFLEDMEARGGLLGRKVEIVYGDDKTDPTEAVTVATKLITIDKVVALVGGTSTITVHPVQDVAADYKVPLLSVGVSSIFLPERVLKDYDRYKYYFHVGVMTSDYCADWSIDPLFKFLNAKFGWTKVAIWASDQAFAKLIADLIAVKIPAPFKIVYKTVYPLHTKDFSPEFKATVDAGAQILWFCDHFVDDCSLILKQWREMKIPVLIAGYDINAWDPGWGEMSGWACDTEMYPGVPYYWEETTKGKAFTERMKKKYGQVYIRSTETYDTLWVLANAIERAGTTKAEALISALEKTEYEGVQLIYTFNPSHNVRWTVPYYRAAVCVTQWQKKTGRQEIVWPDKYKTADVILPEWLKS